ncbi:MAG TPA: hypothetical protein ENG13_02260 [bacterium]|nr:hypothetical protein [bacterium]HEX67869.1 hypothetical protein [bacterium]
MGWPLFFLSIFSSLFFLVRRIPKPNLFITFSIAYYLIAGNMRVPFSRYLLPLCTTLLLTCGIFLGKFNFSKKIWAIILPLLLGVEVIKDINHDLLLCRKDTRTIAREWIYHHIPEDSIIAVEKYGPPLGKEYQIIPIIYSYSQLKQKADIAVISEYIFYRYQKHPKIYPLQNKFYEELKTKGKLLKAIYPKAGKKRIPGPTILIYQLR